MNIIDIIEKKKQGAVLTGEEIAYFIANYVSGEIPDYQISALLMAIYFQGMTDTEIFDLTMAMLHSGETLNLSNLPGITADKHSTGGIGDKVTLILAPLWAATGLTVAKMSGRGLGHTGGTIDKLESIPGFNASLSQDAFLTLARQQKIAITSQGKELVPADKLLYALRDVTATVDSLPLIASSVMSKKLATGCDVLVLDVKYGCGSFMKTKAAAKELALAMVKIGEKAQRKVAAVLSPMNCPLGLAVGNSLEVLEAVEVLSGGGSRALRQAVVTIAAVGYYLAGLCSTLPAGVELAQRGLSDGSALAGFKEFVHNQGGQVAKGDFSQALALSAQRTEVKSPASGYINSINALTIGCVAMDLGAGRRELGDAIDHGAGVLLRKEPGDIVKEGDIIAVLYGDRSQADLEALAAKTTAAFLITQDNRLPAETTELIYRDVVTDITDLAQFT